MKLKVIAAAMAFSAFMATAAVADANSATGIVADGASGGIWSGMQEADALDLHGGTAHAGGPGAYGEYTFQGTGVDVISGCGQTVTIDGHTHRAGMAKITIDGKRVIESSATAAGDILAHVTGLPNSVHVLQI